MFKDHGVLWHNVAQLSSTSIPWTNKDWAEKSMKSFICDHKDLELNSQLDKEPGKTIWRAWSRAWQHHSGPLVTDPVKFY